MDAKDHLLGRRIEMGGKYEIRYYPDRKRTGYTDYRTEYTNSFWIFAKLMITKKIIYFKIMCI